MKTRKTLAINGIPPQLIDEFEYADCYIGIKSFANFVGGTFLYPRS